MQTLIGIIIGVAATIVVAHYYFWRSTRKSLKPYILLNSAVFDGIEQDVRKDLHFSFRGKEITDLQLLELLIANDGERSVSNLIEPLRLSLPPDVRVLDASIIYRNPDVLQASIETELSPTEGTTTQVTISFPVLNSGEYFVMKLLLSGRPPTAGLSFSLLADDLPRTIYAEWLPPRAIQKEVGDVRGWKGVAAGLNALGMSVAIAVAIYLVRLYYPDFVLLPWDSYEKGPSWAQVPAMAACLIAVLLGVAGFAIICQSLDQILRHKPWFALPKELRDRWGSTSKKSGSSCSRVGDFGMISDLGEHASENLEAQVLLVA